MAMHEPAERTGRMISSTGRDGGCDGRRNSRRGSDGLSSHRASQASDDAPFAGLETLEPRLLLSADPTFFFALGDAGVAGAEGPDRTNPVIEMQRGEHTTLTLWADPGDQQVIAIDLDILSSLAGVARVVDGSVTVYNPQFMGKSRWNAGLNTGHAGEGNVLLTDTLLIGFVTSHGLSGALAEFADPTWAGGAVPLLSFEVEAIAAGEAELRMTASGGGLAYGGVESALTTAHFGIGDDAVHAAGEKGRGQVSDVADAVVVVHANPDDPTEPVEPVQAAPPVVDAPETDAPLVDEPVIDEPVMQEPVAEEPVGDTPVTEDPVTQAPITTDPIADEPVVEDPIADEPVVVGFDPGEVFRADFPLILTLPYLPASDDGSVSVVGGSVDVIDPVLWVNTGYREVFYQSVYQSVYQNVYENVVGGATFSGSGSIGLSGGVTASTMGTQPANDDFVNVSALMLDIPLMNTAVADISSSTLVLEMSGGDLIVTLVQATDTSTADTDAAAPAGLVLSTATHSTARELTQANLGGVVRLRQLFDPSPERAADLLAELSAWSLFGDAAAGSSAKFDAVDGADGADEPASAAVNQPVNQPVDVLAQL